MLSTKLTATTTAAAALATCAATAAVATAAPTTPMQANTAHLINTHNDTHNNWACKGIGFTVMHNDRSGGITLPKGAYTVSSPNLSCHAASQDFTHFLNNYQGPIPGWTGHQIAPGYGTYTNNRTGQTFTVKHD